MPDGSAKYPCIGPDCDKLLGPREGYAVWLKCRLVKGVRECQECNERRVRYEQWIRSRDEDD